MITLFELEDETTGTIKTISAGTFASPVVKSIPPGGTRVFRLYLRNTDPTKYYDQVTLRPVTAIGADIVDGSIGIKLLSGSRRPTPDEWAATPVNSESILSSTLAIANRKLPTLGNVNTPDNKSYAIWVSVFRPMSAPVGDFSLELDSSGGNI